jgi:hypothetical protein
MLYRKRRHKRLGWYYEEFHVGEQLTTPARTITESDVMAHPFVMPIMQLPMINSKSSTLKNWAIRTEHLCRIGL